jgi:hypothetical protein
MELVLSSQIHRQTGNLNTQGSYGTRQEVSQYGFLDIRPHSSADITAYLKDIDDRLIENNVKLLRIACGYVSTIQNGNEP